MNRLSRIFLIIIIILGIALGIMTYNYLHWRKTAFNLSNELYQVRETWKIPPYNIEDDGTITSNILMPAEDKFAIY